MVFPAAGHAILRTKGRANLAAAVTFGPYGGFHGHLDKLSFVFFGRGRELGVDPGRKASQAYRLPSHRNWYKATISHNAVLVDAASQRPAQGRLEIFAATDTHAAVAVRCDEAYRGVRHGRLLLLTPTYLLVVDHLVARTDRRFDWIYHNRGQSVACPAATKPGKLADTFAGQEYVKNVRTGQTDRPISAHFTDGDVVTHLLAAAGPGTEVRIGEGMGKSVLDRVPLVVLTRKGRNARFAVVLEPVRRPAAPAVSAVEISPAGAATTITVRRGDKIDTIHLDPATLRLETDGQLMLESEPKPNN